MVRDFAQGCETHAFEHGGGVTCVAFSPCGTFVAGGSWQDKALVVRDVATGANTHAPFVHGGYVRCCSFSPDGALVASGTDGWKLVLRDVATGEAIREMRHAGRVRHRLQEGGSRQEGAPRWFKRLGRPLNRVRSF